MTFPTDPIASMVEGAEERPVSDDGMLTQYGQELSSPRFRSGPRTGEVELSMLLGAMSAQAAAALVVGPTRAIELRGHLVRYVRIGRLRAAGFIVEHTPSRRIPQHVSVRSRDREAPWPSLVAS